MRGRRPGWRTATRSFIAVAAGGVLIGGLAAAAIANPKAPGGSASSAALGGPATLASAHAVPHFVAKPHAVKLPAGEKLACGTPTKPGVMACQAVVPGASAALSPAVPRNGYGPSNLRNAYGLTSASLHRGAGETVAIVDAFSNPDLAKNLTTYRRHFHLPACGTRSGCLRIVNQAGKSGPLPPRDPGWGVEESLDLDMVSAICPRCHILLVEANSPTIGSLGTAENTAIAKGARFVSNSWSGGEFLGQDAFNHYFNHPGDAIVFASGDFGYGAQYPTDTQYVTAVGGTRLTQVRSGGRAFTETVWGGSGSGCSTLEPKASWQHADNSSPTGCLNRTENDVAADAAPSTGVAIYDSFGTGRSGPFIIGGTSVATPIITSVYALAGKPARGTYPASYPYQHALRFNDVSAGMNGACEPNRQYLCHGKRGYDGPTGLGTPKGIAGFSSSGVKPVTLVDPGTRDVGVSASLNLTIHAADSDAAATSLAYSATGLPAGLTVGSVPHSLNGLISGPVPATPGSYSVTVTAKDTRTGSTNTTRFKLYVVASVTAAPDVAPAPAPITSNKVKTDCLAAANDSPGTPVQVQPCNATTAVWQFLSGPKPGAAGSLTIANGICLELSASNHAVLANCANSAAQQFEYQLSSTSAGMPASVFYNPATNRCLNGGSLAAGNNVVASPCGASDGEDWNVAGVLVMSGAGQCMTEGTTSAQSAACASGDSAEVWQPEGGNFTVDGTNCLAVNSALDGHGTVYDNCSTALNSQNPATIFWLPGPGGELINAASGKCLDDVGGGKALVQEDCYGLPGEVWALN